MFLKLEMLFHVFTFFAQAIVIGILYILPLSILHLWDYYKLSLDVQGRTKRLGSFDGEGCKKDGPNGFRFGEKAKALW